MRLSTPDLHNHFTAMRADLLRSGTILEMALSSSPATEINHNFGGATWEGMNPHATYEFGNVRITAAYGKTVGWQFIGGRDFSDQYLTDSSAVVLNESAVQYMGLREPIGKNIQFFGRNYRIIGIIRNVVAQSPYEPVKQTIYHLDNDGGDYMNIRLNPRVSAHTAMAAIEKACKTYAPAVPFFFSLVDQYYAKKFSHYERIRPL